MELCPWIVALLCVFIGTNAQELDLFDALGPDPTPAAPAKPKPEEPKKPAGGDSGGLDILDAFDLSPTAAPPRAPEEPKKPKKPSGGGGGFELDLGDALGPDDPKPDKPPVQPPRGGGGGGSFDDSDLFDIGGGDYKPDGGKSGGSGGKGRVQDPDTAGDSPPVEAGSGQIAGIASAIGMALLGAASSYFAYQKKKLCFKIQGGADPESGKNYRGAQSEPQVLSDLLRTQS